MKYCSLLFGLLLLASCTSDSLLDDTLSGLEIQLTSGADSGIIGTTRGDGIISSLGANLPISLVHQEQDASGIYPAGYTQSDCIYAELKHDDLIEGQYRILNNPKLYYRPDGHNTRFFGWYPHATVHNISGNNLSEWNAASRKVTFNIDATTDILLAQGVEGNKVAANRFGVKHPLVFNHVLTQVQLFVKAGHSNYLPYWGKIESIAFVSVPKQCLFTLPNPRAAAPENKVVVSFPSSKDTDLTDLNIHLHTGVTYPITLPVTDKVTDKGLAVGYALLAPHTLNDTSANLNIRVKTSIGGTHTIPISYGKASCQSGEIQYITLEFTAVEIEATAIISEWGDGDSSTIPVGD